LFFYCCSFHLVAFLRYWRGIAYADMPSVIWLFIPGYLRRGLNGANNDTTFRLLQWQTPAGRCASLHQAKSASRLTLMSFGEAPNTRTEVQFMNNSITIVGHIGKDPTAKNFGDTGNKVVKFSVAVKEYSSNSDEEKTMWLDVDAWNGLGDRVLKTITKGREVVINGRLAINTYAKEVNGETVQMTKPVINLSSFHLCGPKPTPQSKTPTEKLKMDTSKKKEALQ
jgi:single stranded DNA-binding protein